MLRWGVLMLVLMLTGCATGAPVGLRAATGGPIHHQHVISVQPSTGAGVGGGGSGPAALVARAAMGALVQVDAFEELLRLAGLDERDALPVRGSPLTPQAAARLLAVLLNKPVTLGNFPSRMAAGHLLREVLQGGAVSREELLRRVERFAHVAVLRPDGYLAWVSTGRTQQKAVGRLEWKEGTFRAGPLELGRFYVSSGASFRIADASLQPVGPHVAEVYDDADVLGRSLDGAQAAFFELAMAIGQMLTYPMDSLAALQHLPAGVAALLASSPAYLERFKLMTRGEQIQAVAKLTTSLLATWGAAGGSTLASAGPLAGAEATVPVLSLSAEGALVMERIAVPVGRVAAVLGGGPGAALILQRTDAGASESSPSEGPGKWEPSKEAMGEPARKYQAQVTEAPEGYVYKVRGVKFDGFKNGVLLEAKGPGYAQFLGQGAEQGGWFEGFRDMVAQAERQFEAARGIPIQWHFAERRVADFVRELFKSEGLGRITVVHTPGR